MLKKGEVKMIKKLLNDGLSKSEVARRLGMSRNTIRKYANKPDGYIPIKDVPPKETSVDKFLPHIVSMLETAKKENVYIPTTAIYDNIKELGYKGSVRWLSIIINRHDLRQRILQEELVRFETAPAHQMQVDWVEFPKDNLSAFVATLGYSRTSYVEYVKDESLDTLIQCHLNAFSYFGGVPHEGLYDNMKTVIIKRNVYGNGKHKLNPLFADFAKHCGFKIKVCRPYRAKTKGKVERFNHYLRYSFHNSLKVRLSMKNMELNIANANSEVLKWLNNKANKRIHSTTLSQPFKLLQDEIPLFLSLPRPYKGIHPKNISDIIVVDAKLVNKDIPRLTIAHRDLQDYDMLIPVFYLLLPLGIINTSGAILCA